MKTHYLKKWLAVAMLVFHLPALAEDIDLFVGIPPSAADAPNVLLVLDNAANFSSSAAGNTCIIDGVATLLSGTVGGIEQCALYKVIESLPTNTDPDTGADIVLLKIGVMAYNSNNVVDYQNVACPSGSVGGCLLYPITALTATSKSALLAWIKTWKTTGGGPGYIKASGEATGAAMQEAWAYFSGKTGISGQSYASIKPVSSCYKNYLVFVGNSYSSAGSPGDSAPSGNGPANSLTGINPVSDKNANPAATAEQKAIITNTINTTCGSFTFPSSAHETKGYYADEWARYMNASNIVTYTVGLLGPSCQAGYAALLTRMADADVGGGKYFATSNYAELVVAFEKIFSEIQNKESVFASVSLPVSVNTQGTYLNQVFIGMFRPDGDSLPRWMGNLKQYKLGIVNNVLKLLDADNNPAINATKGFIGECARSYWTPTTDDSYWNFTKGNCVGHAAGSNTPDGNVVEKGAQGYKLRAMTPSARAVKTCNAGCTSLIGFDTANTATITQTLLGAADTTERDAIINWARGLNNKGDETFIAATAMRPSSHGDVVHSRPVALNYGVPPGDPNVVVFYGGNDGVLRAVNGNRSAPDPKADINAGSELWSFIPPESYGSIKRLRDNTIPIKYKGSIVASAQPKPYGMDGPITAYKEGSTAWLYAAMRRGGRALYAFDVSTPSSPSLKWKKGCPNNLSATQTGFDTGCTTGFSGIGQTWAQPKVVTASGYGSGASPVLIVGGGYDACEDTDSATPACTSTTGNKIYVLDADTGALLKTFDTDRSVVADLTVVQDNAGLAKYAYTADMGGNVYRITIGEAVPASWTITKIASLGCDTVTTCTPNRKFMYAPDVVNDNGTYVLLIGSGDREKPLKSYTHAYGVSNYFFMVKDKPTDSSWLSSENATCGSDIICKASLLPITTVANPTQAQVDAKKGWYLGLASHEQIVTSAITVYDVVTFSSHQPANPQPGECSSTLGTTNVYNISFRTAASANGTSTRFQHVTGDGLPPSPVAGMVTLDDGTTVPFVIGSKPDSPLEGSPPVPFSTVSQPKGRVYWYIQQ